MLTCNSELPKLGKFLAVDLIETDEALTVPKPLKLAEPPTTMLKLESFVADALSILSDVFGKYEAV